MTYSCDSNDCKYTNFNRDALGLDILGQFQLLISVSLVILGLKVDA